MRRFWGCWHLPSKRRVSLVAQGGRPACEPPFSFGVQPRKLSKLAADEVGEGGVAK